MSQPATSVVPEPEELRHFHSPRTTRSRKILLITAAALCGLVVTAASFWPYARRNVLQELRQGSGMQVQAQNFRRVYFPFPGCVIENVAFTDGSGLARPLVTIDRLTIRGSYVGILTRHVSRITVDGMKVFIPPFGTEEKFSTQPSKTVIDQFVANGSSIEFASRDPNKPPLRFDIHEAVLRNVGWKEEISYQARVRNPEPPGEVTASGKFGEWNRNDPGATPISGDYTFEQADLSVYDGIAGMLSAAGKFSGTLEHIDISGMTSVPEFEVKSGGHPVNLTTEFSAYVDATKGDTFLKNVDAQFGQTHIVAHGKIAGSAGKSGKTAELDFNSKQGRIEDLLWLFVSDSKAPMQGSIRLRAHVEIPPGTDPFLKKVELQGRFGILESTFASKSTQQGIDQLSAGASGQKKTDDPEEEPSDMAGVVNLEDGTAHLADLLFRVPGALVHMHGSFNLINEKIDLRGQLTVDNGISKTESGAKAFALKIMQPFFKKHKKGEIVPIEISGTYEHPSYGLDMRDKHAQNVPKMGLSKALPGRK
jgi:hypothetical protein